MKKSKQKKNSLETQGKISARNIIRAYLTAILILHRNLGAPRIIAAYIFVLFALLSLSFTIRVPVTTNFLPPTWWAKVQSRAITAFIMVINILVYGMIMNWRKGNVIRTAIRIALIASAIYLDAFLIRIVYILIRDGSLF